jgi:outer membrane lipoprotein-sorting protein
MLRKCVAAILVSVAVFFAFHVPLRAAADGSSSPREEQGREIFLLYQEALQKLDSFRFESRYLWTAGGDVIGDCTLRYFLERPGRYRVEVVDKKGKVAGLLICDGRNCWKRWPQGTRIFSHYAGSSELEYEVYMKERAFPGKSVSHQLSLLPQVCMPVFNANVFFGGEESVMEYLDDVEIVGEETIGGEPCHILKVSMMKGQRVRTLWLSKRDHLPRKLFGELVVAKPQTTTEVWEKIVLDPDLDGELFAWEPPAGWEERRLPTLMERLLQVGDEAADFTLDDALGKPLSLSDYKGKIIWLMFWRIG